MSRRTSPAVRSSSEAAKGRATDCRSRSGTADASGSPRQPEGRALSSWCKPYAPTDWLIGPPPCRRDLPGRPRGEGDGTLLFGQGACLVEVDEAGLTIVAALFAQQGAPTEEFRQPEEMARVPGARDRLVDHFEALVRPVGQPEELGLHLVIDGKILFRAGFPLQADAPVELREAVLQFARKSMGQAAENLALGVHRRQRMGIGDGPHAPRQGQDLREVAPVELQHDSDVECMAEAAQMLDFLGPVERLAEAQDGFLLPRQEPLRQSPLAEGADLRVVAAVTRAARHRARPVVKGKPVRDVMQAVLVAPRVEMRRPGAVERLQAYLGIVGAAQVTDDDARALPLHLEIRGGEPPAPVEGKPALALEPILSLAGRDSLLVDRPRLYGPRSVERGGDRPPDGEKPQGELLLHLGRCLGLPQECLCVGQEALGFEGGRADGTVLGGEDGETGGLDQQPRLLAVPGHEVVRNVACEAGAQHVDDTPVHEPAPALQQAVVGSLLDQHVAKAEGHAGRRVDALDELGPQELGEALIEEGARDLLARQARQQLAGEFSADHAGDLGDAPGPPDGGETGGQQVLQGRHASLAEQGLPVMHMRLRRAEMHLEELRQFLGEEWHALAAFVDELAETKRRQARGPGELDHLANRLGVEARQVQRMDLHRAGL
ncbi:hypothetical protein QNA08_08100 [Chelatococcus sp. SYSU_G07232]|uniref:Uncharacterized protein n=1 Tax=Chelatococcus albus TaxID=3047466 RepID=A0ABT7AFN2_9HYPH|nr:hypothetical protein [Chelatococcus sp. SYSU_G07232]MDJ1158193.1 hypothetical protein [Chelatococcus sp. SYSU_G07232]